VILGFAQLIRSQHPADPELLDEVDEIITASGRARGMVEQLLIISHRHQLMLVPVDVRQLLRRVGGALKAPEDDKVSVEVREAGSPLMAVADAGSLERILAQMAGCARTGMRGGGTLVLEAAEAGHGMVKLTMRDSGAGYDADTAARIFEPFFLKRQHGHGDGLEMAAAQHLMQQHGGSIEVETAPGRGTAYHLMLPGPAQEKGRAG
jgi:signal transduction histidine kinase